MMSNQNIDLNKLVVLDLANNHQGSIEHGTNIIKAMGQVVKKHGVRAAIKFQFRQLDTFVHPAHQKDSDNKHVPRFLSTRLEPSDYDKLHEEVKSAGLVSMSTPFDEESVDVIIEMGIDIIKIASCSSTDWPLLERVADSGKPVVCSTGGLELEKIDDLYSFFQHRGVDFAFMHCVSIYPTPFEQLELNQLDLYKRRYPDIPIGWSTHEDPNATGPVQIAVAKGATLFERHVGIDTETVSLNAYSSTPEQVDNWLKALNEARDMCGATSGRHKISENEKLALSQLQRGVYAKEQLVKGMEITKDLIYFAMPIQDNQLASGLFSNGIIIEKDIEPDKALLLEDIILPPEPPEAVIKHAIHEVKAMIHVAGVHLNTDFRIEYSHHYGVENFRETGAVLIDIVNREYCKKIIVQLPNQKHPSHYHKRKEETFQVLSGVLNVFVEGRQRVLYPGDTCLVQAGMWHNFWTDTGCVFEEISTRHYDNDSYYKDKKINSMQRSERKTVVNHWGRYELPDKMKPAN